MVDAVLKLKGPRLLSLQSMPSLQAVQVKVLAVFRMSRQARQVKDVQLKNVNVVAWAKRIKPNWLKQMLHCAAMPINQKPSFQSLRSLFVFAALFLHMNLLQ